MLRRLYEHTGGKLDHVVERLRYIEAPPSRCRCCGAPGKYNVCPPCREAHRVYTYTLSLRCPVRESAEIANAEATALFDPDNAGLVKPYNGHSEACWTTPPTRYTDEIAAACPKCSAPPPATRPRPPLSKEAEARVAALESTKGGLRVPAAAPWEE